MGPGDLLKAIGKHGALRPPSVVGSEGVGRFEGRRVYFHAVRVPWGAWAERVLVDEREIFPIPDGLDDATAMAVGGTYCQCSVVGLELVDFQPGETVLVLGATGIFGQAAIQVAKAFGAGRVVGAGRDEAGLELARERGADAVVQLRAGDDFAGALKSAAKGGYDVVLDRLYGPPLEAALEATKPGARLVCCAVDEGWTVNLPLRSLSLRSLTGLSLGARPIEQRARAFAKLTELALSGLLEIDYDAFPLERASDVWELEKHGPTSKLLVEI
jgi:NADPH:quinone reductase-like Zn-dependent oxidoreductase